MIEGLKVPNKWGPISGSPIVNVSRVRPSIESLFCALTVHTSGEGNKVQIVQPGGTLGL